MCDHGSFDAITLDLILPDGPGLKLVGKIRSMRAYRETPIIVVSMLERGDLELEDQVQAFLTKPVDADELLGALKHAGLPISSAGASKSANRF
jgi:CheY-like chemotaxis protein